MSDVKRVDISALKKVDLESYLELNPEELKERAGEINQLYEGTPAYFNPETLELENGISTYSLEGEDYILKAIVAADANHDGYVDEKESGELSLEAIEGVTAMYGQVAKNMDGVVLRHDYEFFLQILSNYSYGLKLDDERQAQEPLRSNAVHKSVGNVIGVAPYAIYRGVNAIPGIDSLLPDPGNSWYPMDNWALNEAEDRYEVRGRALETLAKVFQEGMENSEPWAVTMDFNQALQRLSSDHRDLLVDDLPSRELFRIFSIPDELERAEAILSFAEAELSTFLGYGGGNTSAGNFFNYTGKHNNIYFAKTLLHGLIVGLKPIKDPQTPEEHRYNQRIEGIRKRARDLYKKIQGDGLGGMENFAMATASRIGSLGGLLFEPIPYRDWSEEQKIGAAGEMALLGITGFISGYKGSQAVRDLWRLSKRPKLPVASAGKAGAGESLLSTAIGHWRANGGRWWNLYFRGMGKTSQLTKLPRFNRVKDVISSGWYGSVFSLGTIGAGAEFVEPTRPNPYEVAYDFKPKVLKTPSQKK